MQSTGQTSTQAVSLVPMQGSQMIYAITLIIVLHGCDPAWTALFAPIRPILGRYEVWAVADPIEAVAEPGWTIERLDPLDAFGAAGSYDRSRLARVYGGTRPLVARGWQQRGKEFTSMTLISPYPDVTFSRLEGGTLVIRWVLERAAPHPAADPESPARAGGEAAAAR